MMLAFMDLIKMSVFATGRTLDTDGSIRLPDFIIKGHQNDKSADSNNQATDLDAETPNSALLDIRFETILPPLANTQGDDQEIFSWCPGGSASGGICSPSNNTRYKWMEQYGACKNLPVGESILLCSHNSGYDKRAPRAPSNETCQDRDIKEQLAWGVRVLDLRVQFFSNNQGASRFGIFHSTVNGRYIESDVLDKLLDFRRSFSAYKEIVILDFHQFKNFTDAAHQELAALIKRKLGAQLVPYSCKDAAIVQLWELNMNTVVAYNHDGGLQGTFWPGVNQRWVGSDTPGKDKLGDFIKEVGKEDKAFGALRSVQAAYYSLPMFVPKDLSEDVMRWFATTDDGGPISSHYIIAIDWALRQRLADNVIHANVVRSKKRNAFVTRESPNSHGPYVGAGSYNIYHMSDGNWAPLLTFNDNTSDYTSIVLVSSSATYRSLIIWDSAYVHLISRNSALLFRVESGKGPFLIAEF